MNKRNKGFSLIELQVTIAISLIVLSSAVVFYIFSWRNFNTGNTLLDVYLNSRNACGWMTRDIKCARQVLQQITLRSGTYSTDINSSGDSHSIVLMLPSMDKNGESIKDTQGQLIEDYRDYVVYKLEGNDLRRIVQIDTRFNTAGDRYYHNSGRNDENKIIARYCNSLTFTFWNTAGTKVTNLDPGTADIVAIYLPINKTTLSLSGQGTEVEWLNPTTKVRLRNKQLN